MSDLMKTVLPFVKRCSDLFGIKLCLSVFRYIFVSSRLCGYELALMALSNLYASDKSSVSTHC